MLRLRQYIQVNVFTLEQSKDIDSPTFRHLKREVTQLIQTEKKCRCTICGRDIFKTVFVFDGYSSFCLGCEGELGKIKSSVYVVISIECEEYQQKEDIEDIPKEQQPLFINQIKREQRPISQILLQDLQPQNNHINSKQSHFSCSPQNIFFYPNQEKSINEQQQKQIQLKSSLLRQKHQIFSPIRQQLDYFNDQIFETVIGYSHEKIAEDHTRGLMWLMKGWTFRNTLIEKKLAKLYGLNQQLKKKLEIEKSIQPQEQEYNTISDQSCESNIRAKMREKTEGLSKAAQFYIANVPGTK